MSRATILCRPQCVLIVTHRRCELSTLVACGRSWPWCLMRLLRMPIRSADRHVENRYRVAPEWPVYVHGYPRGPPPLMSPERCLGATDRAACLLRNSVFGRLNPIGASGSDSTFGEPVRPYVPRSRAVAEAVSGPCSALRVGPGAPRKHPTLGLALKVLAARRVRQPGVRNAFPLTAHLVNPRLDNRYEPADISRDRGKSVRPRLA
jgi:hypothetical protein